MFVLFLCGFTLLVLCKHGKLEVTYYIQKLYSKRNMVYGTLCWTWLQPNIMSTPNLSNLADSGFLLYRQCGPSLLRQLFTHLFRGIVFLVRRALPIGEKCLGVPIILHIMSESDLSNVRAPNDTEIA